MRWVVLGFLGTASACSVITSLDELQSDGGGGADVATEATSDASGDANTDASADAGFSPLDITGLDLWLAADVGVTGLDGGMTWQDRSPKPHTVGADGATCIPPKLLPNTINKLPVLSFSPYDPDCFNVSSGFDDFTKGMVVMIVAQPQTCNSSFIGNSAAFLDLSTSLGVDDISIGRNPNPANTSSGDFQIAIDNTTLSADSGTSWLNGITHLYEVVLPAGPPGASTSGILYLDGTQLPTPTLTLNSPTTAVRGENYIGRAPAQTGYVDLCGYIGEMLVYRNVMTDKDRKSVESYLKTKWGL